MPALYRIAHWPRTRSRTVAVGALIVTGALIAVACGGGNPKFTDPRIQTFPDQGRAHANPGEVITGYNSNPPTSGPHDPNPAQCGIYRTEIPVERLVHTMEHAGVILYYQPEVFSPDEVTELQNLATELLRDNHRLVMVPNRQIEARIALTAWDTLLELDTFEADTIRAFVRAYDGRFNPEDFPKGEGC